MNPDHTLRLARCAAASRPGALAALIFGAASGTFGASQPGPSTFSSEIRVPRPRPDADEPLTPAQLALKRQIEADFTANTPTHRLTLRDGHVVEGRIVEQTPTAIRFREGFAYSGYILATYKRDDIAAISALPVVPCSLSHQDVLLAEEFPKFHLAKAGPYSIATDAPYADVERIVWLLTKLQQQFEKKFASLIRDGAAPQNIQVVFFSSDEPFRAYVRKVAPALVNSAGFYSTRENRLVLLNQLGTAQFARIQDRIDERRRTLGQQPTQSDDHRQAGTRLATLRVEVTSEAKQMTERLVRHEGAHQLFRAYGIQSPYDIEPTWLSEGLAGYCEPAEIGGWHFALAERLSNARRNHLLIPLKTLLDHRDTAGFFAQSEVSIEIAYAESWALTYFLMQGEYRARLIDYVKSSRGLDEQQAATVAQQPDCTTRLVQFLNTDFNTLEAKWTAFINRL